MRPIGNSAKGRHRIGQELRRVALAAVAIGCLSAGAVGAVASPEAANASVQPCSASYIGVPGSTQYNGISKEMSAVGAQIAKDAAAAGQQLRYNQNLVYPAVAPWHYQSPTFSFNQTGLDTSETTGQATLTTLIKSLRAQAASAGCPNAPILLAGYSQGSEVVIRTVNAFPASVRATFSVALLGDPGFSPGVVGDLNFNKSTYRGIRPSFTNGSRYELSSDVLVRRAIDICAASDPICAYHSSLIAGLVVGSRSAHYHYTTITYDGTTLVNYAGNYLWTHKATASPASPAPPAPVPAAPAPYHAGRQVTVDSHATGGDSGHTGPANSYPAGPLRPANSAIWIVCYVNGQSITNSHYNDTTTIWDLSDDGLYYTDAWLYTGTNGPAVSACHLKPVTVDKYATGGDSGHTGPGNNYAAGPVHGANTPITIACYVTGQSITNSHYNDTTTIWDLAVGGYYYSDAWLYTGTNGAAVPHC